METRIEIPGLMRKTRFLSNPAQTNSSSAIWACSSTPEHKEWPWSLLTKSMKLIMLLNAGEFDSIGTWIITTHGELFTKGWLNISPFISKVFPMLFAQPWRMKYSTVIKALEVSLDRDCRLATKTKSPPAPVKQANQHQFVCYCRYFVTERDYSHMPARTSTVKMPSLNEVWKYKSWLRAWWIEHSPLASVRGVLNSNRSRIPILSQYPLGHTHWR